jgi:hypothetical protein
MDSRCSILSIFFVGSDSASLDRSSLEEVKALFNHIKFHESTMTLFRILNAVQFNTVKTVPVDSSATNEAKTVSECEFCYDCNRVRACCWPVLYLHITNVAQPILERRHVILF